MSVTQKVLIDSGADSSLMDYTLARALNLECGPLSKLLRATASLLFLTLACIMQPWIVTPS